MDVAVVADTIAVVIGWSLLRNNKSNRGGIDKMDITGATIMINNRQGRLSRPAKSILTKDDIIYNRCGFVGRECRRLVTAGGLTVKEVVYVSSP
jgi:hypothetical protein